ncbi:hypothetical protein [Brevibacterium luteolum]|uniref:hypothetical protein n=1 Tax=Brevibacterium luteolum TaxID=199591 RepID=UPI0011AF67ED|nr:hypothetical protein [Brevibacterium luteolum]
MRTHRTPRARHRRPLRALAAASAVSVLLSGCGLVGIRTSDEPGAPLGIAVAPTQGPAPEPTETGPQIPEGWKMHRADFAGECASRLEVALPPNAKPAPGSERGRYIFYTFGSPDEQMTTHITCEESFRQSPQEELQFKKEYEFDYGDTNGKKLADRDIRVKNGAGWAYKSELGASAIQFLGTDAESGYGFTVHASHQAEGRMETVSVNTAAGDENPATVETAEKIVQHVFLEHEQFIIPDWQ